MLVIDTNIYEHERKIYGLLNIIGDLGGVFGLVQSVWGFFILPISYHSFVLKAISILFKAKTTD